MRSETRRLEVLFVESCVFVQISETDLYLLDIIREGGAAQVSLTVTTSSSQVRSQLLQEVIYYYRTETISLLID